MDKLGIPLRPESKSIISILSFIIWKNQPWLSTTAQHKLGLLHPDQEIWMQHEGNDRD
jgi:hypothetical protein